MALLRYCIVGNVIVCLTVSWPIIFQYQSQFLCEIKDEMSKLRIYDVVVLAAILAIFISTCKTVVILYFLR
jgi:hypothetical protein